MTDFPLSEILRGCPNGGDCDPLTCFHCDLARKKKEERLREAAIHRATLKKQEWIEAYREFHSGD